MNVFVIHAGKDRELIKKEYLSKLVKSNIKDLQILTLEGTGKIWKPEARRKIAQSDVALYFVGDDSHTRKDTIDYELKQFIKKNKRIYVVKLDDSYLINKVLYRKPSFGNVEYINPESNMHCQIVNFDEFIKLVTNESDIDIEKELGTGKNIDPKYLIEQYKLYLTTSEDLVKRRQSVSNFYISINSAIITLFTSFIAILTSLSSEGTIISFVGLFIFLSVGIVLCVSWMNIINSYGRLNSAKMRVISAIENYMLLNVYDSEWKVQSKKIGNKKYKSFTSIEKDIPKIFIFVYTVVGIVGIVLFVLKLLQVF